MMKNERLTEDLHLRVSKSFQEQLLETAERHHLKPSTLTRYLLMKHLPDYQKSLFQTES